MACSRSRLLQPYSSPTSPERTPHRPCTPLSSFLPTASSRPPPRQLARGLSLRPSGPPARARNHPVGTRTAQSSLNTSCQAPQDWLPRPASSRSRTSPSQLVCAREGRPPRDHAAPRSGSLASSKHRSLPTPSPSPRFGSPSRNPLSRAAALPLATPAPASSRVSLSPLPPRARPLPECPSDRGLRAPGACAPLACAAAPRQTDPCARACASVRCRCHLLPRLTG